MTEDIMDSAREILELDFNAKDMIVLGALLKSQHDPSTYVDFEKLRAQLEIDEGGKKGKDSLIYRSLSWLESTGYIQIDRSSHKHRYNSNVKLIDKVFRELIQKKVGSLEHELKELDSEIQIVSEIDPDSVQSEFLDLIAGESKLERPIFAEGWENIIQLLDEKIYKNAKKGDTVRITLDWLYGLDEFTKVRIKFIESLLKRGVFFKGVEHRREGNEKIETRARLMQIWKKGGYNLGYRCKIRKDSTYQFVARNSEGIVLIISESPLSATWLPRESNPELIDNAIQSFEADYQSGTDVPEFDEEI